MEFQPKTIGNSLTIRKVFTSVVAEHAHNLCTEYRNIPMLSFLFTYSKFRIVEEIMLVVEEDTYSIILKTKGKPTHPFSFLGVFSPPNIILHNQ